MNDGRMGENIEERIGEALGKGFRNELDKD
jgi:hypothetical protein